MSTNFIQRLFVVTVSLGLLLSACSNASTNTQPANDTPSSAAAAPATATPDAPQVDLSTEMMASKPYKIAFVSKEWNFGNSGVHPQYWLSAYKALEQAATDFGVEIEIIINDQPCERQTTCIEHQIKLVADVLEQGEKDAIVLAALDSNRLAPVVDKAINAGLPIITMDTTVNSDNILTFVTSDNSLTGETIGRWLAENIEGQGRVVILEGPTDHSNAIKRRDGILAGLRTGNIEVLDTEPANWQADQAKEIAAAWLEEHENIDAIIAANDPMALGAVEAVEEAERTDIIVTGHDANTSALEAVEAGRLTMTIPQSPDLQARIAVQLMIRHLENGDMFPSVTFLPKSDVITAENVGQFLAER